MSSPLVFDRDRPIRVLVVDDSAVARLYVSGVLTSAGCHVVAAAADAKEAWKLLSELAPDVLVLDVDMPVMDGLSFLQLIMEKRPTPVVMCSALTHAGRAVAVQALRYGAVAAVGKSGSGGEVRRPEEVASELVWAVKSAAKAHPARVAPMGERISSPKQSSSPAARHVGRVPQQHVVALGLSTGGVAALSHVLNGLSGPMPGILVVQHMPAAFTASLAQQLDRELVNFEVSEAQHGSFVSPGKVFIAPGGRHMRLGGTDPSCWQVLLDDESPVHFHRPSVDVLFHSVARAAGRLGVGVLLTGMGEDGAQGLFAMRQMGAQTAAQDELSSVVFGMPAAAIKLGASEVVLPLENIASWLMQVTRCPLDVGLRS